jgi:folate-binding protein YgfZ
MLTDLHVLESGSMMLLDVPAQTAADTVERLDQFIFSEDVRVESLAASIAGVWLHGPQAGQVLGRALAADGVARLTDYTLSQFEFRGSPVSVVRIDQLAVPGYCVYLDRSRAAELEDAVGSGGARPVAAGALDAARVEAGYPLFGVDMNEATIPLEAGIESRAISFSKGCYVGQEVVIRVLHRGGGRVARRLVTLRLDAPPEDASRPARGMKLYASDKAVGEITTAAESPQFGWIALGYVHRDYIAPGSRVEVEAGPRRMTATVAEKLLA